MDRRTFLSTAIVGAGALSGCLSTLFRSEREDTPLPEVPSGSWPQYAADGANTSATDAAVPARGNLAWTSRATRWQPVVSDGTVYVTNFDPSRDGSVLALDAQDGTKQWRTTLDADGDNGIVFVDDRCIVAHDAELAALDPRNGEQLWTQTTSGIRDWELLVADESTGTVLLASRDGIEAFDAENGERRWDVETVRQIVRAPAVYDGQVFAVGNVDGAKSLVGLSLEDGSNRWQTELTDGSRSTEPIATQHGVVLFDDGSVVVHDRESGTQRREIHSFEGEGSSPQSIATDDGTLFVTSSSSAVALDVETGTEQWHRDASVYNPGICIGAETVVLPLDDPEFSSGATTISALDRESGEMRWYYAFDLDQDPNGLQLRALVDGAVFFTATNMGLAVLGDVAE